MTPIHNIVVATDFSPGATAAVDRAVQVARTHGAVLRLLHVFDVSAWRGLRGVFDPQRLAREPPPDVQIRRRLNDLSASLATQTGLQVEAHFSVGEADGAVRAYVAAHETALLVIGSRAEPSILGLGSTASRLVRAPHCPVLMVRCALVKAYATVLAAVDLSAQAKRAATVAIALFPAAQHHLALALGPGAHESAHAQALHDLNQVARSLSGTAQHPVLAEVLDDVPARAILERAAAFSADCVVVGHHGGNGGAQSQLGSMAQQVLQHTLRDVLVVQ
ncbi:MAG: universal stress protein [Gammaproteobacteria bacterium]|uniref:universal stress protein n=1 Tax=Rhodoferax sp. TaxID=50421 RepID=UPI001839A8BD|nr:universal stress protein [Rhodoferax sp.]MBU3900978.1 universal stress protein [Gammaproteobacteria bacterium]MBA3058330.1 universal stress protein [Rhodoferax sp.]MBU3996793.1 universal stress protein [Gammaproteobacteria bacterium]MBU4017652.1 universal stress protein [Gammaproteobacteria bacterium]MBU4081095.1 universal stress protein [Gammaproteobacteria bacterium]